MYVDWRPTSVGENSQTCKSGSNTEPTPDTIDLPGVNYCCMDLG